MWLSDQGRSSLSKNVVEVWPFVPVAKDLKDLLKPVGGHCSSCRMSVLLNNLTDSAKDLQEHLFNVNDYICKPNNVSYSVHELNKLHLL